MPRIRPPYPPEFRREAVKLVLAGRSVRGVAENLGCSEQSLHHWVKQHQLVLGAIGTASKARAHLVPDKGGGDPEARRLCRGAEDRVRSAIADDMGVPIGA